MKGKERVKEIQKEGDFLEECCEITLQYIGSLRLYGDILKATPLVGGFSQSHHSDKGSGSAYETLFSLESKGINFVESHKIKKRVTHRGIFNLDTDDTLPEDMTPQYYRESLAEKLRGLMFIKIHYIVTEDDRGGFTIADRDQIQEPSMPQIAPSSKTYMKEEQLKVF
jgi:hypothetical protein